MDAAADPLRRSEHVVASHRHRCIVDSGPWTTIPYESRSTTTSAAPADGLLPAAARDPALRLVRAVVDRRLLRRDRDLGRRARARRRTGRVAQLPRGVRPLRDTPLGLRGARRESVSGLHGRAGLSARRRDPGPAAAGSLEGRLAPLPRAAGAGARCSRGLGLRTRRAPAPRRAATRPRRAVFFSIGGAVGACAFLGWFAALALGRMPNGLRDLAAYGVGYNAQACAYAPPPDGPLPELRPRRVRRRLEPAAASGPARARRRRTPLTADGLLPLAARAAASRLAVALDRCGDPGGDRELAGHARPRPLGRAAAPLPRRLRPLLRRTCRRSSPCRQPVPRLRRRTGLSRRHHDRTARSPEPVGHVLPRLRSCSRRSIVSSALSGVLVSSRPASAGSRRSPPVGCRPASATSARCRCATRRRRTPTGSSSTTGIRTRARLYGLPPSPSPSRSPSRSRSRQRSEPRSPALRVARRARARRAWAAAAWSLWSSVVPGEPPPARRLDLAGIDRGHHRPLQALRALLPDRVRRLPARADRRAARLRALGYPLRQRVGRRPDRHRNAARDDRPRARLALAGAVPPGGGLVGPPLRPDRQRLCRDAVRELVPARRRVPLHLLRARRS